MWLWWPERVRVGSGVRWVGGGGGCGIGESGGGVEICRAFLELAFRSFFKPISLDNWQNQPTTLRSVMAGRDMGSWVGFE